MSTRTSALRKSLIMSPFLTLISAAFILGAVSGLTPGPLLTLVVTESLQRGFRSGAAVSIAPLMTDAPIILTMMVFAGAIASIAPVTGWLYLLVACYLVYLSIEVFRFDGTAFDPSFKAGTSFLKGAAVNLLNPAPYAFWFAVGVPLLKQARTISWMAVPAFLGVFYLMLVGSKLLLAYLIGKNRHVLKGRTYRTVMLLLGIFLLVFAVLFVRNGVEKLT
jgi:threonine/homoserine/homoserine lactone efflux protein